MDLTYDVRATPTSTEPAPESTPSYGTMTYSATKDASVSWSIAGWNDDMKTTEG
jgi:hypothetical protein